MKLHVFAWIALAGVSQSQAPPWKGPKEPVYVVMTNRSSEGSGANDTKFGDLLMVQIFPESAVPQDGSRPDGKRIYEIGKAVPFFIDGHRRGTVRIARLKDHQCDGVAAIAVPSESFAKDLIGLATNISGIPDRSSFRREATAPEKDAVVRIAIREFLRNSVQSSLMTRVNVRYLLSIRTDDSDEPTLIGSFFVQSKSERHDVFVIARAEKSGVRLEYSEYSQTEDLEDFTDHASIKYVDHLDLDGDASDEVMLKILGYESEGYEILTRESGHWRVAATGGGSGC